MNNTFSFSRLSQLLAIDFKRMESKYGLSMLAFAAGYFAFWAMTSLLGESVLFGARHLMICFFMWFCVFLAPSKIYGFVNDKLQGMSFAALPASPLEKWLSMLLICLVFVPLQSYIILLTTDIILSLLPFGAFEVSIFTQGNQYWETIAHYFSEFMQVFAVISFAVLGNLLFKKHKASKTVLILFVAYFALLRLYVFVLMESGSVDGAFNFTSSFSPEDLADLSPNAQKEFVLSKLPMDAVNFINGVVNYVKILTYTLFAGSVIGSYFRIKSLKY